MATTRLHFTGRFVVVLTLFLSASAAGSHARAGVPSVTVEEIAQVWKDREDRIQSLEFEWKESDFVPKGTRPSEKLVRYNPIVTARVDYPPNDTTFHYDRLLKIDGRRTRFESQGPNWVMEVGEYLPQRHVTVNDSVICKDFFDGDPSSAKKFNAHGFLRDPATDVTTRQLELYPILLCYRPFAGVLDDTGLSEYLPSPVLATDPEGDCLILTRTLQSGVACTIWVAPEHDYLPVRWQMATRGQIWSQIQISHMSEPAGPWIPSGWTRTMYARPTEAEAVGVIQSKSTAHVTAYSLNRALPASDFDVVFPVGTWVTDERNDEDYILQEGGGKRLITEGELLAGYSYAQYAATESGKAGEVDSDGGHRVWVIGGVAVAFFALLGVLALAVGRRRHRTAR